MRKCTFNHNYAPHLSPHCKHLASITFESLFSFCLATLSLMVLRLTLQLGEYTLRAYLVFATPLACAHVSLDVVITHQLALSLSYTGARDYHPLANSFVFVFFGFKI